MSLWFRPFEAAFAVVLVDVALTTVSCEIAYDSCLVLLHPCSLAFTQIGSGCLSVCFRVTFSIILSNTASVCSNPLFPSLLIGAMKLFWLDATLCVAACLQVPPFVIMLRQNESLVGLCYKIETMLASVF